MVLLTLLGAALIGVTLRDVLQELFNPELTGSISSVVARTLWRLIRRAARRRPSLLRHAGPLMLAAIGASWVILIGLGAALVYLPRLPQDFDVGPRLPDGARRGFVTAVYVSSAQMTSVGSGDISPKSPAVRMMASIEPILGLVLITAWITWVLSIYPIIAKRRAFEREVALLREPSPDPSALLTDSPCEAVPDLLRHLTTQLIIVGTQLEQSEISYYFVNEAPELSLASQLPYVLALSRAAEEPSRPTLVRHYGTRLRRTVEMMLRHIAERHLKIPAEPPERVLDALAADHLLPSSGARA